MKDTSFGERRYSQICGEIIPKAGIAYCTLYVVEKLHDCGDGIVRSTIVLVLNRIHTAKVSIDERLILLRDALAKSLTNEERLEYRARAMHCVGPGYEISVVVEAYKNRPSLTAYFDGQGRTVVEQLHRMPTVESLKRARALTGMLWNWNITKSAFSGYLDEPDLIRKFSNAADRLAYVAKRETEKCPKSYPELMSVFRTT